MTGIKNKPQFYKDLTRKLKITFLRGGLGLSSIISEVLKKSAKTKSQVFGG